MDVLRTLWSKLEHSPTRLCLESLGRREHQALREIERDIQGGPMITHLLKLERMGLAIFDPSRGWRASAWGHGVLRAASEVAYSGSPSNDEL